MQTRTRRLGILAAVVTFLTLVGSVGAAAYWTTTAGLTGNGKTATIGVAQAVTPASGAPASGTPLAFTYSSSALQTAGAITVTNTGSREAAYTTTLAPSTPVNANLAAAISVTAFPVASTAACTASATAPGGSATGNASDFTASGTLAAGASVVLCVQTSMTSAGTATYSEQSGGFSITTALRYAAGSAWTATSSAATFTQTVAKSGPVVVPAALNGGARYNILGQGACVTGTSNSVTLAACQDLGSGDGWQNTQWRFSPNGNGTYTINLARNSGSVPSPGQWQTIAAGTTAIPLQAAAATADRSWYVESLPSGGYQIRSAQSPTLCATVTNVNLWNSSGTGKPWKIVLADCNGSSAQSFSFTMVGNPTPPVETMTCSGNEWSRKTTFTQNVGYEQEIVYRVFLANAATPDVRTAFTESVPTGYNPYVQFSHDNAALNAYANSAAGGFGNTIVYVEQMIGGVGAWTPTAEGKIALVANGTGSTKITCGWQ